MGDQHQQELLDAEGVMGIWDHQYDLILHHLHLGTLLAQA